MASTTVLLCSFFGLLVVFSLFASTMSFYSAVALLPVVSRVYSAATCATGSVNISWHPSPVTYVNGLSSLENSNGVYGFVFNSSTDSVGVPYGTYNWCNMPHVRAQEYNKAPSAYKLEYVEVVSISRPQTCFADARSRFTAITSEPHTLQTRSHTSPTPGIVVTKHSFTTLSHIQKVTLQRSNGKSIPRHPTLSLLPGLMALANFHKLLKVASMTRISMEKTSTTSIIPF